MAHIGGSQVDGWRFHALEDHLRGAGEIAARFGAEFGAADWARLAALWHDVGKHRGAFQRYIRTASGYDRPSDVEQGGGGRVDHSTAGAILALERLGPRGRLLAYAIAGHHAGLPDWYPSETGQAALSVRVARRDLLDDALAAHIPPDVLEPPSPAPPLFADAESVHLWIRLVFSCLVDADFLDTEWFMDLRRSSLRGPRHDLVALRSQLDGYLQTLPSDQPIHALRNEVRRQCLAKAALAPGLFSLTVPTGGGKTLTSLSFALDHAIRHGQHRIIYAIPYISIIEQTADVFRRIFGDVVLEHHSNLDPAGVDDRSRLAAENWDAPLVVTTTVQLFESLFGARTSRCRKLHNVANSVVILDEAQLLPPGYLAPIVSVVGELARRYGVTVIVCTATQPALASRRWYGGTFRGLEDVRELTDDVDGLWAAHERVTVEWPSDLGSRSRWGEIAAELSGHDQVLCVVNRRAECRELVSLMPASTYHLSALMCPEHRSEKLAQIRARLKAKAPVRVVSTQLIEAGVDVDFPVVYRALAGLDSIAQAAGRCNREGLLRRGRVVVFVPPKPAPAGHLRKGEQATRSLLSSWDRSELFSPRAFNRYFELLYGDSDLDDKAIMPLLTSGARQVEIAFRTASDRFSMVPESTTVLVPFRKGTRLLEALRRLGPDRWILRRLQRYGVSVHSSQVQGLLAVGDVQEVRPGLFALTASWRYDRRLGLLLDDVPLRAEDLVA